MQWVIASLLALLIFQPIELDRILAPIVKPMNDWCLVHAPASAHRDWYQAIVCGKNLPPSQERTWFQQSGLIHIIVVSGSHLVFLDDLLKRIIGRGRWAAGFRWLVLLGFSLASDLQPPIVRALSQRTWTWSIGKTQRHLPSFHVQFLAGISVLALFPSWWSSLSLLMSWVCSLALTLPLPSRNTLLRSTLIYLLMIPALLGIQLSQPGSILFNVAFGPLLGFVMFPVSLAAFVHPAIAYVTDWAWSGLFSIFALIPMPESQGGILFPAGWVLIYLAILQAGGLLHIVKVRRRQWHTC